MTERKMATDLSDVMIELLASVDAALDLTTRAANAAVANAEAVQIVAKGLRERPTKRQTLRALTIVNVTALIFLAAAGLFFYNELRQGQQYIVTCTAPGPNPPPMTGNDCWDRLVGNRRSATTTSAP